MLGRNKQRAFRREAHKRQEDAIQIISQEKPVSELRTKALDSLIKWKLQSGFTKVLQQHNTVAKKRELWMTLKDKAVQNYDVVSDDEDEKDINIPSVEDTILGKKIAHQHKLQMASINHLSNDQFSALYEGVMQENSLRNTQE